MSSCVCEICQKANGIYTCPRCGRKYCSSACYKSKEHSSCSESFYREWCETSLKERTFDDTEKLKMIEILKKHKEETLDSEDELSLADRLVGLNLDTSSEGMLWQHLNEAERTEFIELMKDEKCLTKLVPVIQPWWTDKKVRRVVDLEEIEEKVQSSVCPPHPMDIKRLSAITTKQPSDCLKFNLVNILYAYSFLCRFYNCDLRDFLLDVAKSLLHFSPVLTGEQNYYSLEEAVQDSIRLITTSDLNVHLDFVKSISNDVCCILEGPENAPPTYFVMCALHDMKLLLLEVKRESSVKKDADLKKKIMPVMKKIEFLMSWCSDFSHALSELASELVLMMVPDFIADHPDTKPTLTDEIIHKKVPAIEEIED